MSSSLSVDISTPNITFNEKLSVLPAMEVKETARKEVTTEEEHRPVVFEVLCSLWELAQLHGGNQEGEEEGIEPSLGLESEGDIEPKVSSSEEPNPPSRESIEQQRKRLVEHLEGQAPQEIRKMLNSMLTTLQFDPSESLLETIDAILRYEQRTKTFVESSSLPSRPFYKDDDHPTNCRVAYWQGDITTLKIHSIVNAANTYMLGCFTPGHACIDNVIHCRAGPRLRKECREIMTKQGALEKTGTAKITKAYCLPSAFVLHTVGPIVKGTQTGRGRPTPKQKLQLASCYRECLNVAKREGSIRSVAFCCISTGVFGYPQDLAAEVALATVKEWLSEGDNADHFDLILFNVFTNTDLHIYQERFPVHFPAEGESQPPSQEEASVQPTHQKEDSGNEEKREPEKKD